MSGRGRIIRGNRGFNHNPTPDLPCTYSKYTCSLKRLDNYSFCLRHILEDPNSPFRQCSFSNPHSHKQCHRAAPDKKDGLCSLHSRQSFHSHTKKKRATAPPQTTLTLLNNLKHHQVTSAAATQNTIPDPSSVQSRAAQALLFACDPTSDSELSQDVTLLPRPEDDSELESADSDSEPLEHAGIFTTEEVARIYLEKLKALKTSYANEFKGLTHILRGARKRYVREVREERETMCSISAQPKLTPQERDKYEELKALIKYQRHYGQHKLLYHQSQEKKKLGINPLNQVKTPVSPQAIKCIFGEGSWKCGEKCVPLSKYCNKHILHDSGQVLFKECGSIQGSNEQCGIPIIPLPNTPLCVYHSELPSAIEVSDTIEDMEIAMAQESLDKLPPRIIDLNDSSNLVLTEIPPENILQDDGPPKKTNAT